MFGMDLTGDRLDDLQDPVALVDQDGDCGADEPVRDRVAPDPNRMQESLSTFRVIGFGPTSSRSDGSSPSKSTSVTCRWTGIAWISLCTAAVDLLAPRLRAGVEPAPTLAHGSGSSSSGTRRSSLA